MRLTSELCIEQSRSLIPSTKGQTGSGSDGNWYFYRVSDLEAYLKNRFGIADITANSKSSFQTFKGIILFRVTGWSNATGHFTLWDGAKVAHGDYFNQANSISLWKIS
jgi:hypothetical protein